MTNVEPRSVLDSYAEGQRYRGLSGEFAEKLDPYVRGKFLDLLKAVERGRGNDIEEQL